MPCPSQLGENLTKMTASYWHTVREYAAKEFGPEVCVLAQCAAAGDITPGVMHYKEAQARRLRLKYGLEYDVKAVPGMNKFEASRREIAERILDGIREVYAWAKKEIFTELPVRHVVREVRLNRRFITEKERLWCEETLRELEAEDPCAGCETPTEVRVNVSAHESYLERNRAVLERYREQKLCSTLPAILHVVRVGDVAFALNRFELFTDYMHRIQARSPFIQTFVVQLAVEGDGYYLPTERAAGNNGYSASLFDNMVSYEGGQQLVEYTLEMLNEARRTE